MVILQTLGYTSWAPFLSTQSHKELSVIMIRAVESASPEVRKSLKIEKNRKKLDKNRIKNRIKSENRKNQI